jgi:hypothetical protein
MPANQQFKERKILLNEAESVARMGSWKLSIGTDSLICSSGLRKLLRKSKSDVITYLHCSKMLWVKILS